MAEKREKKKKKMMMMMMMIMMKEEEEEEDERKTKKKERMEESDGRERMKEPTLSLFFLFFFSFAFAPVVARVPPHFPTREAMTFYACLLLSSSSMRYNDISLHSLPCYEVFSSFLSFLFFFRAMVEGPHSLGSYRLRMRTRVAVRSAPISRGAHNCEGARAPWRTRTS